VPEHKNQHFVPRCALKPFSLEGTGKAINVFNVASMRLIKNAPVKGQCARDYLYAKDDLAAEKFLTEIEGRYAAAVRSLSADEVVTAEQMALLRLAILIQTRRTKAAIDEIRKIGELMADKIYANDPSNKPVDARSDREVMWQSMRMAAKATSYVDDLKVIVFRNKTSIEFVTCDNPAFLTNRFSFQKLRSSKFGVSNSGAILSMPLTPRLSAICYDKGTYNIVNGSGTPFVDLTDDRDARAINEWQYLNANENIYFSHFEDGDRIKSDVGALAETRAKITPEAELYVRDDDSAPPAPRGLVDRYRSGMPEEEAMVKESLLAISFQHPEPSTWPSKIKLRNKPRVYSNGSTGGPVRKAAWLNRRR